MHVLHNCYADTKHIAISVNSYQSMSSYVIMYLFIRGTKVLSFATRLLQQEARPQGDLEQITVVYSTEKKKVSQYESNNKNSTNRQQFCCELPVTKRVHMAFRKHSFIHSFFHSLFLSNSLFHSKKSFSSLCNLSQLPSLH